MTKRDEFVAAREVQRKEWSRVFEMSNELLATVVLDWSEPVQLRVERQDDGTFNLIARRLTQP